MQRLVPYLLSLVLALWVGGLITLFMSVSALFAYNRDIAREAAPVIFFRFERYQIVLAAVAVACAGVWYLYKRSLPRRVIILCLLIAAIGSVVHFKFLTPAIEGARADNDRPRFARLHGRSMLLYVAQTATLFVGGITLIHELRRPDRLAPERTFSDKSLQP